MAATATEDIEKYVDNLVRALDLENEEERKKFVNSYHNSELGTESEFLDNLVVTTCDVAPYGLVFINFECAKKKRLKDHTVHKGDSVLVSPMTNSKSSYAVSGYVDSVTESKIVIMFDNIFLLKSASQNLFHIVKVDDDKNIQRMISAVNRLIKFPSETDAVTRLLFGSEKLENIPLSQVLLDNNGKLKFNNESLHNVQKEAIKFALESKTLGVIHGPPGTGKTTTLVELILQLVKSGEKVLVCAPSNVAVDNIMAKMEKYKLKMVRLGHPSRVSDEHQKYTTNAYLEASMPAEALKEAKAELEDIMKRLKVSESSVREKGRHKTKIGNLKSEIHHRESKMSREGLLGVDVCFSTLGSSYRANILRYFPHNFFSTLVVDEASQCLEAGCWMAIPYVKRTILAGDHHQLAPLVLSQEAAQMGLGNTLMERAIGKLGSDCFVLLTHQFRMNEKIMDWISKEMYDGQLTADLSVANHLLSDIGGVEDTDESSIPLLLVDTSGCNFNDHSYHKSYGNLHEADLVAYMADRIIRTGVQQKNVVVITPYQRQVNLIKERLSSLSLEAIEVRTVDGFQGGESEAVILSLVRSNPEGEIGFISDRRRINVAVSRARRLLCVVTDVNTVGKDETFGSLIHHIQLHGKACSAHELRDDIVTHTSVEADNQKHQKEKKNAKPKEQDWDDPVTYKNFNEKLEKFAGSNELTLSISELTGFQIIKIVAEIEQHGLEYEVVGDKDRKSIRVGKGATSKTALEAHDKESVKESKLVSNNWDPKVLEKELLQFVASDQITINFPSSLNTAQRAYIHEQAEKFGLLHTSVGVKDLRRIVVSKSSSKVGASEEDGVSDHDSVKLDDLDVADVQPASNVATSTCRTKKMKKKQRVLPVTEPKNDDSDELLDELVKTSGQCASSKCKTGVRLIGHDCPFCKQRFCIPHTLPEVHGCTTEAKRAARKEFVHPKPKSLSDEKRKALQKSLKTKLGAKADLRTAAKKK